LESFVVEKEEEKGEGGGGAGENKSADDSTFLVLHG